MSAQQRTPDHRPARAARSEKTARATEKRNQYVFRVRRDATKAGDQARRSS